MTTMPDMTEYRAMAENALRTSRATGTRRVVSNRGTEHARAVTGVLIASADRRLSFLCSRFSAETFEVARVREFLDRPETEMHVLLDSAFDDAHPSALSHLKSYMAGEAPKLRVRRVDHATKFHIGVADSRDARVETDTESRKATVVFGDPVFAQAASRKFDSLWHVARVVGPEEIPSAD